MSLGNKVINGIELYSVSAIATETYQREAKRDKNMTNYELERKLTALTLAGEKISDISNSKSIYKFGGFAMTINEKTHKIEVVYWYKENHKSKATKEQIEKLMYYYDMLGLDSNGRFKNEIA